MLSIMKCQELLITMLGRYGKSGWEDSWLSTITFMRLCVIRADKSQAGAVKGLLNIFP